MSASENEALVRRFLEEAYNQGNLSVGDQLLADDCIFYTPAPIPGIAGWKQYAAANLTAFPGDLQVTIDDLFAAGDKGTARWTAQGTHNGPLLGHPRYRQACPLCGVQCLPLPGRQDRGAVGIWRRAGPVAAAWCDPASRLAGAHRRLSAPRGRASGLPPSPVW
jgi:predicted ester cyclase